MKKLLHKNKPTEQHELGKAKSLDYQKLPKQSTTHPPGHRQRHQEGFSVIHGPALVLVAQSRLAWLTLANNQLKSKNTQH